MKEQRRCRFLPLGDLTEHYWPPVAIFQSAIFNWNPAASEGQTATAGEGPLSTMVPVLLCHHWETGFHCTGMWNHWANKPSFALLESHSPHPEDSPSSTHSTTSVLRLFIFSEHLSYLGLLTSICPPLSHLIIAIIVLCPFYRWEV